MNRSLLRCLLFTLCLSSAALAQPAPAESSTPPWLPRGVFLGTFIRSQSVGSGVGEGTAVAPEVRLQWQLVFFHYRTDTLGLLIEPTAAAAASKPASVLDDVTVPLTQLQYYSVVFGLGYTSRRPSGLEWGFQIGTGPLWYSARFRDGSKDKESYLAGLLDGRLRLGYRFGPVSLGVAVGYGDPYNYRVTSLSAHYVGGFQLGLYADWR